MNLASMSGSGVDMSVLATIQPPDPEAQKKYEAMGLPDPFAFAALTALGAIPNPMEMLNSMMLAAQSKSDTQAAPAPYSIFQNSTKPPQDPSMPAGLPPGRSFVEAFRELQKTQGQDAAPPPGPGLAPPASGYALFAKASRAPDDLDNSGESLGSTLARSAKEAEAEAKKTAEKAKEVALSWSANFLANRDAQAKMGFRADPMALRSVADAFAFGGDDEGGGDRENQGSMAPAPFTLASLLGNGGKKDAAPLQGFPMAAVVSPTIEKICISKMPLGTTESAVRLECARHGAVKSVILEVDGSAAYVTFANPTMAETAVKRMSGRVGILGSAADPVKVKLIGELPDHVRHAVIPGPADTEIQTLDELPDYLKPRVEKRKTKKRSKSRRKRNKKKKSKSMVRWLDRSRSKSHTAQGQYIRAVGYSSTVKWWEKKRSGSSTNSSNSSGSDRGAKRSKKEDNVSRRPRQVAVKGNWAEFVQNGKSYYYNVLTGVTTWDQPGDFDSGPSRRPWEGLGVGFSTRSKDKPTGTFL